MENHPLPKQQFDELNEFRLMQFYVQTEDDWYPNWENNIVLVTLSILPTQSRTIRISVWGADDTGMERDEELPENNYDRLARIDWLKAYVLAFPNPLNRDWLESNGFIRC